MYIERLRILILYTVLLSVAFNMLFDQQCASNCRDYVTAGVMCLSVCLLAVVQPRYDSAIGSMVNRVTLKRCAWPSREKIPGSGKQQTAPKTSYSLFVRKKVSLHRSSAVFRPIRAVVKYSNTRVVFEFCWNYSNTSNHSKCNNAHSFAEE